MAVTRDQAVLENNAWMALFDNPATEKQAVDAVNDFTRTIVREDSFFDRIIPAVPITNAELDRQVYTDKPMKIVDKEPGSPAAKTVPFGTLPDNFYIRGPRYAVMFDRIVTQRAVKDVDELRTWSMDIRQVISDNCIRDMLAELDSKFVGAIDTMLVAADTAVPWSGVPQWVTLHGGVTRENLEESYKVMPRTPAHLVPTKGLVNNVTVYDFLKWGQDEAGGDFSASLLRNGWAEAEFGNLTWVTTNKRDLVPDGTTYLFADPKFIGKNFELEPVTMYVKREAFLLEFFSYGTRGASLGHSGGLARIDYA